MMLGVDVQRCRGRREPAARAQDVCPLRNGCMRYRDLVDHDMHERRVEVRAWLCEGPSFEARILMGGGGAPRSWKR